MSAEPAAGGPARTTIAVSPGAALAARPRLFGAIARAFPVAFEPWDPGTSQPAALVVFETGAEDAPLTAVADIPVLHLADRLDGDAAPVAVALHDVAGVDRRLRGAELFDALSGPPLPVGDQDDVLASTGAAAAWTRTRGVAMVDRVRSGLPELADDEVLYTRLGDRAIAMVALIELLRRACGTRMWQPAPLRATIVFDDPNLRRPRYGHIDYRELLRHADEHGYHAVMAMIPLDAGRADRTAVDLFARRADRLSLVIHGNDHSKRELLMPADGETAITMAAQALRRMARFEQRTGLRVDRVMMPPHGRCSGPMSRALGAVGFDALSAIHPLPWTADWRSGPVLAGWRAADIVAGCPVIPRMPLSCLAADIALRAFLDHPVILYGHHQDVAGGLDLLAEAAGRVNRLGDVRWTSAGEIAASNHELWSDGGRLSVRPYSRRTVIEPPEGTRMMTVQRPDDALDGELVAWSLPDGTRRAFGAEAPVDGAAPTVVRLHGATDVDVDAIQVPGWRPGRKLRRAATEARDRAAALRAA